MLHFGHMLLFWSDVTFVVIRALRFYKMGVKKKSKDVEAGSTEKAVVRY